MIIAIEVKSHKKIVKTWKDLVAQLVLEQYTFNVWVSGSSPDGVTL